MPSRVGILAAAVLVVIGTACAGRSTVEASVRDAFVNCMAEQGITVENVEVRIGDGRHVDTFSWEPADGEVAEDVGQECEDSALQQFEVSRT